MTTRSQAKQTPEETVATLQTSIPCFCGNQRILKNHSWNCKQQMLNWIPTGDPYTWTEDDYAHESEDTEPMNAPHNDEMDDFGLPDLFNETGYRGSSDINPDEPPAQLEEEEDEQDDGLPHLEDLDHLSLDETPPGPPLHQSTPERNERPQMDAANQFPGTNELYPPFGPHDLYKARQQQIHQQHHEQYIKAKNEKARTKLRKQLFQTLEDAETSFKLLLANPEMIKMTPEELQQKLAKPECNPEPKKKGIIKKLLTPKADSEKPRTRLQVRQEAEKVGESSKNIKK
jgi:hypothetical protein